MYVRRDAAALLILLAGVAVPGRFPAHAQTAQPPAAPQTPRPSAPGQIAPRDSTAPPVGTGTAVISGRIVAAETGTPLRRAVVRISSPELREGRSAATDELGRYEFKELPASRFTLSASKSGYLTLSYGQRRPFEAARPVEIVAGQSIASVDIALPRGSAILAHITDDFGEPLAGVQVQALQNRFVNGQRRLAPVGTSSTTNDLGEARVYAVPPGAYYVSATLGFGASLGIGGGGLSFAPTYYPGTAVSSDAQRVTLGIGQEASVAFALSTGRPSRLGGVVRYSDGSSADARTQVMLAQSSPDGVGGSARSITLDANGRFALTGLLPGQYRLIVSPPTSIGGALEEYAELSIILNGDDRTDIVLVTSKGGMARGQVVFDGDVPPAGIRPGALSLMAPTLVSEPFGSVGRPKWNDDWTFEMAGLTGQRLFRLSVASSSGWFLKSVSLEGKDITDTPLDFSDSREYRELRIELTQKRAVVAGTVTDAKGAPASEYVAVLFPEEPEQWTAQSRFFATGRPDQQGQFKMPNLPPGRYLAIALDYLATGEERDPDLLKRLRDQATRVTVGDGESKTISLKLVNY